jgi:hypothetical protein
MQCFRKSSDQCVLAVAVILLATAGSARAENRHRPLTAWDARAVDRARTGAVRRLQDVQCQKVLADFRDARGRTIQQNLEESQMSAADYLVLTPFLDGGRERLCRGTRTFLVAVPGVQRVMVCAAFADFQIRNPHIAESMVIHEMLHTLGLGENPPSSGEITARVEARCR